MKNLLYFFFGLLLLAGCGKKSEDPAPTPPAQAVAGLYTVSSLTINGSQPILLPFTAAGVTTSGTINMTAVAGKQDELTVTSTLKSTGSPDITDTGIVQVKAASKGYELFESGNKVGTIDGNTLTITDNGQVIVAKK